MKPTLTTTLALTTVLLVTLAVAPAEESARRVVVLGFDGMDPDLVVEMGATELPHLHRLLATSDTLELATTTPAESPVSWASLITGCDPDVTGVYDFLYHARRGADGSEPAGFGYRPRYALVEPGTVVLVGWPARGLLCLAAALLLALVELVLCRLAGWRGKRRAGVLLTLGLLGSGLAGLAVTAWVPLELPTALGRRGGTPYWEVAAAEGLRVRSLTVPMTFPATCECTGDVRTLAGLGVPDVRGTSGTYHVWTTQVTAGEVREFGGIVRPARLPSLDLQRLTISGPVDFVAGDGSRAEVEVGVKLAKGDAVELAVPRMPPLFLRPRQWSAPVTLTFTLSPLIKVRALARFHLLENDSGGGQERFSLYLAPMSFHPEHVPPTVGISHPPQHAALLSRATAPFKTLGWAADTWALADGFFDEETFCQDLAASFAERRTLLRHHLDEAEQWQVLTAVFEDTDCASHMLWHHLDPQHPRHDPAQAAAGRQRLLETYRWSDEVTGEVLERFEGDPDTLVLVVSDHGFASFRRQVNLNSWLRDEGYLQVGTGPQAEHVIGDLFDGSDFFGGVDWRASRAFSLGLGTIYLNMIGLDPEPRVRPSEAEPLAREIAGKLLALRDPEHPTEPVVLSMAYKRESDTGWELVRLPGEERLCAWGRDAPELVVGFAPGTRVSWQTSLGGIPQPVFEDNDKRWTGDHCSVDPAAVAGILAANQALDSTARPPSVLDIAPTVLDWLGLESPAELVGDSLLQER